MSGGQLKEFFQAKRWLIHVDVTRNQHAHPDQPHFRTTSPLSILAPPTLTKERHVKCVTRRVTGHQRGKAEGGCSSSGSSSCSHSGGGRNGTRPTSRYRSGGNAHGWRGNRAVSHDADQGCLPAQKVEAPPGVQSVRGAVRGSAAAVQPLPGSGAFGVFLYWYYEICFCGPRVPADLECVIEALAARFCA